MAITVAVLDTGIYRHIDFGDRIVGFVDCVNGKNFLYDDSGHGTHVAGIIAGDGTASHKKYRGIAPNACIAAVKVLDNRGNGIVSNVLKGTEWILENKERLDIKIVNVSFGTTGSNDYKTRVLVNAVENMWDEGLIVVAAAGNNGPMPGSITAPGISCKIITVGAYDDIRFHSGRGPIKECDIKPEVVVTGTNIVACSNMKNKYSSKSGTSMSTPIVSGAIARLMEHDPYLTPEEVKHWLRACCEPVIENDMEKYNRDKYGWGKLNMAKFVMG